MVRFSNRLFVVKNVSEIAQSLVFTNAQKRRLNYAVVARSVWYPALERAGLQRRNPHQTRHTFATLLLAAGESPEWIANQMVHTTTTVLFRVYSRYVPNLTRRDGSAFAAFLNAGGNDALFTVSCALHKSLFRCHSRPLL